MFPGIYLLLFSIVPACSMISSQEVYRGMFFLRCSVTNRTKYFLTAESIAEKKVSTMSYRYYVNLVFFEYHLIVAFYLRFFGTILIFSKLPLQQPFFARVSPRNNGCKILTLCLKLVRFFQQLKFLQLPCSFVSQVTV